MESWLGTTFPATTRVRGMMTRKSYRALCDVRMEWSYNTEHVQTADQPRLIEGGLAERELVAEGVPEERHVAARANLPQGHRQRVPAHQTKHKFAIRWSHRADHAFTRTALRGPCPALPVAGTAFKPLRVARRRMGEVGGASGTGLTQSTYGGGVLQAGGGWWRGATNQPINSHVACRRVGLAAERLRGGKRHRACKPRKPLPAAGASVSATSSTAAAVAAHTLRSTRCRTARCCCGGCCCCDCIRSVLRGRDLRQSEVREQHLQRAAAAVVVDV